jgi:hypothetical protein
VTEKYRIRDMMNGLYQDELKRARVKEMKNFRVHFEGDIKWSKDGKIFDSLEELKEHFRIMKEEARIDVLTTWEVEIDTDGKIERLPAIAV